MVGLVPLGHPHVRQGAAPEPAPKPYESPVKFKPLVIAGLENAGAAEEGAFGKLLYDLIKINHTLVEDLSEKQKDHERSLPPLLELRDRKDVEKELREEHAAELQALLDRAGVDADPAAFRRYGSARRLYTFDVDDAGAYG